MRPDVSRSRKPGCPSNLDLDELLAGDLAGDEREGRIRSHLGNCRECGARLAAHGSVELPPLSTAVRAEHTRAMAERTRRRRKILGAFVLSGCAAVAVMVLLPIGPTSEEPLKERTKGGLALTVSVKRAGGRVDAVQGEGRLQAGDEMRFSLTASTAGHAVVLGLDAAPSVTLYVPGAVTAPADSMAKAAWVEAAGVSALPGSIVADETAGAERVFAVLCPTPRDPRALRDRATVALARAGGRPEAVNSLDTGCLETSVLLHKEPRPR